MQILNKIVISTIILIIFLCTVGGEELKNLTTLVDDYNASSNEFKNLNDTKLKLEKEIEGLNNETNKTEKEINDLKDEIVGIEGNITSTNKTINEFNTKTGKIGEFSNNPLLTTALGGIPSVIIGLSLATLIGFMLLVNRWKNE